MRRGAVGQTQCEQSPSFSGSDGSVADRFSWICWRRHRRCGCRLNGGTDHWIRRRTINRNSRTDDSGRNSARNYAARYNATDNAGNRRANSGHCSPDAGDRNSGNHPKHDHDAHSADDAQRYNSADHSQHTGNRDAECESKFADSRIDKSAEHHSADNNTTNSS